MSIPLWVVCDGEPSKLTDYNWYDDDVPARKFYCLLTEIGRRLRHLMEEEFDLRLLSFCEQCADGKISEDDLGTQVEARRGSAFPLFAWIADRYKVSIHGFDEFALDVFPTEAAVKAGILPPEAAFVQVQAVREHPIFATVYDETDREWGAVVRCIYGPNPFTQQRFSAAWRTEHTVGIAGKMYDEREFAAVPILADALEEAGCDNADILTHCREPGVHVRGCWVVDLVLGKS